MSEWQPAVLAPVNHFCESYKNSKPYNIEKEASSIVGCKVSVRDTGFKSELCPCRLLDVMLSEEVFEKEPLLRIVREATLPECCVLVD